jgi:sulfur carrier protein
MTIVINGESRELPDGSTAADAAALITGQVSGVAVAVNDDVVPKSQWARTALADGDSVEILTAVQGG